MAVMGSDNIVVGKSPSKRPPKTVIVENLAKQASASAPSESSPSAQEEHCGAMSQQPCYGGMISTPQKFLHLVGCHEPKGIKSTDKSTAKSTASGSRSRMR
jgi:hypothetical protein